jgi:hypothetical protein
MEPPPPPSLSLPPPPPPGIKTGQLYKRAPSNKNNWKKRYFLLSQPNLLQYYEDKQYKKVKNQIVLIGSMEVVRCTDDKVNKEQSKKFVFELRSSQETFYMAADSESELAQWKDMIDMVIQGLREKDEAAAPSSSTSRIQGNEAPVFAGLRQQSIRGSVDRRGSIRPASFDAPTDATTFEFDEHLCTLLQSPNWLNQNQQEIDVSSGALQVRVVGPMNAIVVRNSGHGTHGIAEHSILASVNGECVLLLPFDAVLEKLDSMPRPLKLKFLPLPAHEGNLEKLPRGRAPDKGGWQNRYFELKNGILYYYETNAKKICKGEMYLKGASVHRFTMRGVDTAFSVQPSTDTESGARLRRQSSARLENISNKVAEANKGELVMKAAVSMQVRYTAAFSVQTHMLLFESLEPCHLKKGSQASFF